MEGQLDKVKWYCMDAEGTQRQGNMVFGKRTNLADLVLAVREVTPHIGLEDITVDQTVARWTRPSTPEEIAEHQAKIKDGERRREEWERATYERLKAKFEGGES